VIRATAFAAVVATSITTIGPTSAPARREIVIKEFAFQPATVVVSRGDTVVWSNRDILPHTTAADSGAWTSKEIAPGGSFTWVATSPGERTYHCAAHPGMTATLVVR
jgi:plastocyanin